MFNKLCLYERGNVTEPEMCSAWLKNSISYNSCQYSFVIPHVSFKNVDGAMHFIYSHKYNTNSAEDSSDMN